MIRKCGGTLAMCLLLAACDEGRLTLSVADAPIDSAQQVVISFEAVELERSDGATEEFPFSPPLELDMTALQGGLSARLLDDVGIPTGDYRTVRLRLTADSAAGGSRILLDDDTLHELALDAQDESRLAIGTNFNLDRGDEIAFVIDFDLRKSILARSAPDQPFRLRPSLRLVQDNAIGAIAGAVDPSLRDASCRPAIYVYATTTPPADDVGSSREPLASARLDEFPDYRVAFLPAGDYLVAFTCQAGDDDPETDDEILFSHSDEATVLVGRDTIVNFPPP